MDQCEEKLMKKDSEPDLCSLKKKLMIHAILITSKLPLHLWTNPSADSEKSVQATLVDYLSGRIHSGPRKMWMKTAGIQWKWRASAGFFLDHGVFA